MKKRFNLASETFRDKVQKYTKEYKYNTTEKKFTIQIDTYSDICHKHLIYNRFLLQRIFSINLKLNLEILAE